jgi:hypothetical protein
MQPPRANTPQHFRTSSVDAHGNRVVTPIGTDIGSVNANLENRDTTSQRVECNRYRPTARNIRVVRRQPTVGITELRPSCCAILDI